MKLGNRIQFIKNRAEQSVAPKSWNQKSTEHPPQPWLVLVHDKACGDFMMVLVEAINASEAERKAVAERNADHGYGADEDGGFVAVYTFDRTDVMAMLTELGNKSRVMEPPTA